MSAQSFPASTYTLENGLNTNYIHDITQDRQGRMWFATEVGVSVYDGYTWKNYDEKDGLPRTEYFRIRVDSTNGIIAIPYFCAQRIAVFRDEKWQLIDSFPPNFAVLKNYTGFDFIYKKDRLILYLGTPAGLLSFDDGRWRLISKADGLADNRINAVRSFNNIVYAATENGISFIQEDKINNSLNSLLSTSYKNIKALEFELSKDSSVPVIWLLGGEWIGNIQDSKFNLYSANNRMSKIKSSQRIRHTVITFDKKDRIYYGTELERYYLEKSTKKITSIGADNGFTTSGSSAIFLDRESNLWFASFRGIDKVSNMYFQNFFALNGLLENEVASILEVRPGYYIFGHNGGLTIFKEGEFHKVPFNMNSEEFFFDSRVLDLCKDSAGTVWIAGSRRGLGKLVNGNAVSWLNSDDKSTRFYSVTTDPKGTVWIATQDGLYKLSADGEKLILVEGKIFRGLVRKLYCDAKGSIFGAKSTGLAIYKDGQAKEISDSRINLGNSIYAIYDYKNGSKFLGTADGLYLFENGAIRKFEENEFSIDRKVFFITHDKQNNFWFGTNDGVVRWDGKNKRRFSAEDGLSGRETNRGAYTVDSFGKLWIGTDRGLSCYSPKYDTQVKPPILSFLKLEDSKGKLYDLSTTFDSNDGENSFIFRFRSISFINEKFITYRVKLEGFEDEWLDVGASNQARFTNLKPGEYTFLIQTKNIGGGWSKTYSSSKIILHRPFYYQWWFLSFAFIIISLILYAGYNYSTQVRYSARLTAEVQQRTRELNESESKLRAIIQNAPNTISAINREGKFLYVSQMWKAYDNLNTSYPLTIWELIPDSKIEEVDKILSEVFDNKRTVRYEINYMDKNNIERWIENSISPVLNNTAVAEAIVISNDVTERKLNEIARREIEERQEAVLKALPLVFYNSGFGSEYAATWITSNVFSCTGYEIDNFLNEKNFWNSRIHPDDREFVLRKFEDLLADKTVKIEYRWLCADGYYKWFLEYAVPKGVDESGNKEFLGIWLDITENKQMQQRLERLNECFLQFGVDPTENIQQLISLCGTEMSASYVFYNNFKNDLVYNIASWNLERRIPPFSSEGTLCGQVLKNNKKLVVINDVDRTKFAVTDPAVSELKIITYIGSPIIFDDKTTGSLCVVYQNHKQISENDQRFVRIIGSAIAVEEERRRSEVIVQNSLQEKEILLKEIHHRVKNNLQVISSLLYLQSIDIEDEKALSMFKDSTNRVRSMALVHEKLYQSKDLAHINLEEYINNLAIHLFNAYRSDFDIKRKIEIEKILLSVDLAIPCGLIVNELVTNSLKYAFTSGHCINPEIRISIKKIEEEFIIEISDNGIGFPENFNLSDEQKSLGLKLVKMLTNQLDGSVVMNGTGGAYFKITFNHTTNG